MRIRGKANRIGCIAWFLFSACSAATVPPTGNPGGAPPGTGPSPTPSPPSSPPPSVDPGDPLASSLFEMRSVFHVHSPYSHDACDEQGLINGVPNAECRADLREAICADGLDFVGLTDHPDNMRHYPMADELLIDLARGDQPILEAGGIAGNRLRCDDGRTVIVTQGYEATHTLPIGFSQQPSTLSAYGNLLDSRPMSEMQALVAELKSSGAVVSVAHSEQDSISTSTLLSAGVDAMEWYNPHGNFDAVIDLEGSDPLALLDSIGGLDAFLAGSPSGAHADLIYLLLLARWPEEGFAKWREAQATRLVTGMLGSDVHQNIGVEALCTGSFALPCQLAAAATPGRARALALLAAGGKIVLTDGERIDTYSRVLRWLENRVFATDRTMGALKDALRAGRSYGLFSVFGEPKEFRFAALAGGALVEMGGETAGPVEIVARLPKSAVALAGVPFSSLDGSKVEPRAALYRTTSSGTTLVAESTTLGAELKYQTSDPGAYHLEIWLKPKHLVSWLGSEAQWADREFLWLITNPIRVR